MYYSAIQFSSCKCVFSSVQRLKVAERSRYLVYFVDYHFVHNFVLSGTLALLFVCVSVTVSDAPRVAVE